MMNYAVPITDPVNRGMRSLLGEWSRIMPNNRIMSTPDTASSGGLRVWCDFNRRILISY